MRWARSNRFDKQALPLADRHYNRQKPGTPQFVAPGKNLVFLSTCKKALWVTRVQDPGICKHAWPGAWECSLFRNEGAGLSSELILEAIAATRFLWGDPPPEGMITFVNRAKVKSKKNPGYCYIKAGFSPVGKTKTRSLHTLHIAPELMPQAEAPIGAELSLF